LRDYQVHSKLLKTAQSNPNQWKSGLQPPGRAERKLSGGFFVPGKNLWQGGTDVKRKAVE